MILICIGKKGAALLNIAQVQTNPFDADIECEVPCRFQGVQKRNYPELTKIIYVYY